MVPSYQTLMSHVLKPCNGGTSVGPDDIRNFSGTQEIADVQKYIFVTAPTFAKQAREAAGKVNKRNDLIDGMQLAKLMIRYNVGCRDEEILHLKKVDQEFFE